MPLFPNAEKGGFGNYVKAVAVQRKLVGLFSTVVYTALPNTLNLAS